MDAAPWPQEVEIGKTMEEISSSQCTRKAKPQEQINCPRCNSTNTKFCYYNNYSLTQPRYFCKTCRRYWTEGGSLRNVPVGGGSRKNKRSSSSSSAYASASASVSVPPSSSADSSKLIPDLNPPNLSHFSSQNPKSLLEGQDLNLAFPEIQDNRAMELLRTEIATRGLNSYIQTPMPVTNSTLYSAGYPMQEFKPTLSFPVEENGGRILFPLGEFKQQQLSSATHHHNEIDHHDQNKGHDQGANNTASTATTAGFWNGMFGHGNGGSW